MILLALWFLTWFTILPAVLVRRLYASISLILTLCLILASIISIQNALIWIGNLRSLYKFLFYKITVIEYVEPWGTQIFCLPFGNILVVILQLVVHVHILLSVAQVRLYWLFNCSARCIISCGPHYGFDSKWNLVFILFIIGLSQNGSMRAYFCIRHLNLVLIYD